MDELGFQAKVHLYSNYTDVIKEIKNLERYYKTMVLVSGNTLDLRLFKAKYVTGKLPWGPKGTMMHPLGTDGSRLNGKSEISDGSWMYKED